MGLHSKTRSEIIAQRPRSELLHTGCGDSGRGHGLGCHELHKVIVRLSDLGSTRTLA